MIARNMLSWQSHAEIFPDWQRACDLRKPDIWNENANPLNKRGLDRGHIRSESDGRFGLWVALVGLDSVVVYRPGPGLNRKLGRVVSRVPLLYTLGASR